MASRGWFKNQMERVGKLLELISSHNSFFSNMGYSNICPVCCCPGSVQSPGLLVSEGRHKKDPGEYSAGSLRLQTPTSTLLHRPVSLESIRMQASSYILSSAVGPPLYSQPQGDFTQGGYRNWSIFPPLTVKCISTRRQCDLSFSSDSAPARDHSA